MTLNTLLSKESSLITSDLGFLLTKDTPTVKAGFAVKYVEIYVGNDSRHSLTGTPIVEVIKQRELDHRKAAALARARQRLADKIAGEPKFSLTQLRLSKGISQTKLAEILDTKQPQIARLEKGETDVRMSTIEKLSKALDTPIEQVFAAVRATREARTSMTGQDE